MKYAPAQEGWLSNLFGFGKNKDKKEEDSNTDLTQEQLQELKTKIEGTSDQIFNDKFNDEFDKPVDGMSKEELKQYCTTVKQVSSFVKANFFKIFTQLKKFPISQLVERGSEYYNSMNLSGSAKEYDNKMTSEMNKWIHDPNNPICKLLAYREESSISDEVGEIKNPPERKKFESKSIAELGYKYKADIVSLINTVINWDKVSGELELVKVAKDYEDAYDKFGESLLGDGSWQYEYMGSNAAITGWLILLHGFLDYDWISLCARHHCMKILKVFYKAL